MCSTKDVGERTPMYSTCIPGADHCVQQGSSDPPCSHLTPRQRCSPVWTVMYVWLRLHMRFVLLLPEPLDRLVSGSEGELAHRYTDASGSSARNAHARPAARFLVQAEEVEPHPVDGRARRAAARRTCEWMGTHRWARNGVQAI